MTRARRPRGRGWAWATAPEPIHARDAGAWRRGGVLTISTLIDAELPDRSGIGPQWHLSISDRGRRPTDATVRRVLRAFRLSAAEEDNHHPGVARHFFMPVDAEHRVDCECKEDEQVIVEDDGYRWTTPRGSERKPGICRGCELERMTGKPCSIHRPEAATG